MSLRPVIAAWAGRRFFPPLLALGSLATPFALHSAEPIQAKDTFVHSFSRFAFPTNVGNFHRVNLKKYDKEGRNISAGYNLDSPPLAITIYVYPAPKSLTVLPQQRIQSMTDVLIARHFIQVTNDVVRARPTTQVETVKDEVVELKQGEKTRKGKRAVFAYNDRFGGLVRPVQSEAYLFLLEPDTMFLIDDRFYFKLRSTYPAPLEVAAGAELKKFLDTFVWPTK